jgi:hypothetical protein
MPATTATPTPPDAPTPERRLERLSAASARRVIDPDVELTGSIGPGQIIPDDLLSIRDLELELTAEQRHRLAAEEAAAITEEGIRFEAVLMAGLGLEIQRAPDVRHPWVTYALHEIGEETRHSRLFVRELGQLGARARNPFNHGLLGMVKERVIRYLITRPPLLFTMVLAGEEIPDLYQKLTSEHPGTDPFIVAVNRYHRQEEARHIAFARIRLPEVVRAAPRRQVRQVAWLAPFVIRGQFEGLLHPGIYRAVGLPGWRTWRRVHASRYVVELLQQATRPILRELLAAGAIRPGRVPAGWRRLAGVDRAGRARPA